jgi:twinkle protein
MTTELTPKQLGQKLAERADEFVRPLLPDGVEKGGEWCVGSINGEPGESLKIKLTGDNAGLWKDWAKDAPGGDLLDLYAGVKRIPLAQAMRECARWLGIEHVTWGKRKQREGVAPEKLASFRRLSDVPEAHAWLIGRGFSQEVIDRYRIFADVGKSGKAANVVFPYIMPGRDEKAFHLKFRDTRQKQVWTSKGTRKGLYGWHALDPTVRSVMLVEGEPDVLAAATYGFQVLGIPNGGGGGRQHEWIETEWDELVRFDTIFLAIESDGAGMTAIQELAERLGRERCRVVKLPFKDINHCLLNGVEKSEIVEGIRSSRSLDPAELRNAGDYVDAVIQRFHPLDKKANGFYAPWASLMGRFHFEYGATTIVAGFSGHGKTELCGQITLDAARQGVKACVASFEFMADKWLQRTVRQALRNADPPPSLIRHGMAWIGESMWIIDTRDNRGLNADKLISIWEYAYRRYGIKLFVMDNFQKLNIPDDDLAEQKRVINLFTAFAVRTQSHVIVVHHFRKNSEDDHQKGNKLHLKGASALGDMVDNIWIVMRNRRKEEAMQSPDFLKMPDEEQKKIRSAADTWFKNEKFRNGDEEPMLALYFDKPGHIWTESPNEPAPVYCPPPKQERTA